MYRLVRDQQEQELARHLRKPRFIHRPHSWGGGGWEKSATRIILVLWSIFPFARSHLLQNSLLAPKIGCFFLNKKPPKMVPPIAQVSANPQIEAKFKVILSDVLCFKRDHRCVAPG